MRDATEEGRAADYIRQNPVKAGFVRDWREWPWMRTSETESAVATPRVHG